MNNSIDDKSKEELAKVRWRSRRGMLELDTLLELFCENAYFKLSPQEKASFNKLLEAEDQDLMGWLVNHIPHPSRQISHIINKIKDNHNLNTSKSS